MVLALLSQLVQFEVDGNAMLGAYLGQFGLQLGHPATQTRHLEDEHLV